MYKKDFETWNRIKQDINYKVPGEVHIKEGEIWWCSIGINIGNEIDGKNNLFERPVLILKRFPNNSCLIVPLSTTDKEHQFVIPFEVNNKISKAVISQIRTISSKRLIRRMHKLPDNKFEVIRNFVKAML